MVPSRCSGAQGVVTALLQLGYQLRTLLVVNHELVVGHCEDEASLTRRNAAFGPRMALEI